MINSHFEVAVDSQPLPFSDQLIVSRNHTGPHPAGQNCLRKLKDVHCVLLWEPLRLATKKDEKSGTLLEMKFNSFSALSTAVSPKFLVILSLVEAESIRYAINSKQAPGFGVCSIVTLNGISSPSSFLLKGLNSRARN